MGERTAAHGVVQRPRACGRPREPACSGAVGSRRWERQHRVQQRWRNRCAGEHARALHDDPVRVRSDDRRDARHKCSRPVRCARLQQSADEGDGGGGWGTWSNGYTGNVYFSASEESVTITLPSGTAAVYFYIEGDQGGGLNFTATAEDGLAADTITSPPTPTNSAGGAAYFGFYATAGQTISKVAIVGPTPSDGFAVGEFGIAAVAPPTVATGAATDITTTGAQLGATINPNNNPTSSFFEYGTTASYGQGAPVPSAHDGNGTEQVTASAALTGLQPGTLYHYRLVAINGVGTRVNGADETFTTTSPPPPPPPSTARETLRDAEAVAPVFERREVGARKSRLCARKGQAAEAAQTHEGTVVWRARPVPGKRHDHSSVEQGQRDVGLVQAAQSPQVGARAERAHRLARAGGTDQIDRIRSCSCRGRSRRPVASRRPRV
jgi:hypothetical protein